MIEFKLKKQSEKCTGAKKNELDFKEIFNVIPHLIFNSKCFIL